MLNKNTKILVNWDKRKIIHTHQHRGSEEFRALLNKGYEEVGEIKDEVRPYWAAGYFDPTDKYLRSIPPKNIDEINT